MVVEGGSRSVCWGTWSSLRGGDEAAEVLQAVGDAGQDILDAFEFDGEDAVVAVLDEVSDALCDGDVAVSDDGAAQPVAGA